MKINENIIKNFNIEFKTFEQCQEWFNPETKDEATLYPYYYMRKNFSFVDKSKCADISVELEYYENEKEAIEGYNRYWTKNEYPGGHSLYLYGEYKPSKKISANCEYSFTDTEISQYDDFVFWFLPRRDYSNYVIIRYKNLVFNFSEHSNQNESQINRVIEQILV